MVYMQYIHDAANTLRGFGKCSKDVMFHHPKESDRRSFAVRMEAQKGGKLWPLMMTARPEDIHDVLVCVIPFHKPDFDHEYGGVCGIIADLILHRPHDAVQFFSVFKALLDKTFFPPKMFSAKQYESYFRKRIERTVRCWDAVCKSGPSGKRAIEESDVLMQLFMMKAGGEDMAAEVIKMHFAPSNIIYSLLSQMNEDQLSTSHWRYGFPVLRKECVVLLKAARANQSLWDINDGAALSLIGQTVTKIMHITSDQGSQELTLCMVANASRARKNCNDAIDVLKVKFLRSLLTLHRIRAPHHTLNILEMVKEFLPTWHSFYGTAPPHSSTTQPSGHVILEQEAVLQDVIHDEPAAERDESTLQLQADEEWAALVEERLHSPRYARTRGSSNSFDAASDAASDLSANVAQEKIHLLRFGSGDGQRFREALLNGPEFLPCRNAMEIAEQPCVHSSQAIILVKPEQYADVSLALEAHELHPFHVIITESLEYLLAEVLAAFPCRRRPREKIGTRVEVTQTQGVQVREADPASQATGEQDAEEGSTLKDSAHNFTHLLTQERLCIERTFICKAPDYRDPRSVVQSTTEAVNSSSAHSITDGLGNLSIPSYHTHFRGVNPRRVM